jgi:hypothetical protein
MKPQIFTDKHGLSLILSVSVCGNAKRDGFIPKIFRPLTYNLKFVIQGRTLKFKICNLNPDFEI